MSAVKSQKTYKGVDRRGSMERRSGQDRRNLMRYEAVGSERRNQDCRRKEDFFWNS